LKSNLFYVCLLLTCTLAFGFVTTALLKVVDDFSLVNVDGNKVSLKDYTNAKGFIIIFTCNHCPFAKLYPPRLNQLNDKYKPLGVPLIAISSTDTIQFEEDTYLNMLANSAAEDFYFPYL